MEADSYRRSQPLLPVVARQVAQLLDLYLVGLALVDVGEAGLPSLGHDGRWCSEDVLEPALAFLLGLPGQPVTLTLTRLHI